MADEVEGTSEESTEAVQETTPDQSSSSGPNPAWNDVLSLIPETLHEAITPHFSNWDKAANARVESANAKIKEYESYAPFVEHGISSDDLTQGLQLLHAVNNNPQEIYDALRETYPQLTHAQAVQAVEEISEEVDDTSTPNPKLEQLEQGFNILAQNYLAEQQAKEAQALDAQVASEFAEARKKYGDFDEGFVSDRLIAKYHSGDDKFTVEQAVQEYQQFVQSVIQKHPRPFAPHVLGGTSGGGSGIPSGATDVTELSDGDTRKLVADILRQNAQQ